MILRLGRRLMTADLMGLFLVLGTMQTLVYGISSSLRDTDTKYYFLVCLTATLIGLGFNKRKVNGVLAAAGVAALGIIGIWILGARLASPFLDLVKVMLPVIPQIIPSIRSHTPLDTIQIADAWIVILQASSVLAGRVHTWLIGLNRNIAVDDPLVRNMSWILVVWFLSGWAGWFAGRRNAIASILPSVLLLAAIISYSEYKIESLWLMVFIFLLLMGIWNYKNHTIQWEKREVDYSESIRYDSTTAVLFLAVTICVLAFVTPSFSWREIRDYLRERNQTAENETADLLGIQKEKVPSQGPFFQQPVLPREHLLSGGFALSQKIVMTIRTGEMPPMVDPSQTANPSRYYWRSTVYDVYVGAGWYTSTALPQTYNANTPLIPGLLNGYRPVHLDVQLHEPEGKLFWSGILFSADIPLTADWRVRPVSDLFAGQSELIQADLFAALTNATSYQAESYVPVVSVQGLRTASAEYPEDIKKRYLALPASVPERVYQLAQKITKGQNNSYDMAKAIEGYLRTYPYDLDVPAPPPDHDVADYFLFDLKKGYCDYYATAMVVLVRASGIPARFVSGYSPGNYDAPNARYIIRELNAHSWVEVYFPGIGWVEFEPTASQPEIDRSGAGNDTPITQNTDPNTTKLLNRFRFKRAVYWALPGILFLFFSLIYFTVIEKWLYMRLAPDIAIERIYRRLYRLGRPLAGERAQAETAFEFKIKMISRIGAIKEQSRLGSLLKNPEPAIESLTSLYQFSLFSHQPMQKNDAKTALLAWKLLRRKIIFARLISTMINRRKITNLKVLQNTR